MSPALRFAARSDVGLVREVNEDSAYAGPRLLAVADGIGGQAAGEVASSVVITTLAELEHDVPDDLVEALHGAVRRANDELRELAADHDELEGMGTTLTALLRGGNRLGLVHVGDSRAYLLRGAELLQVTRDHTFVQSLVDEGRISTDEASTHPQRNVITRALDGRGDVEPDVSIREMHVGDRWLLCSDGLSGVVSEQTLRETLPGGEPGEVVDRLIDLALRAGAPDNVTVVVGDVVDDEAAAGAPLLVGAVASTGSPPPSDATPAGRAAQVVAESAGAAGAAESAGAAGAAEAERTKANDEADDEPPPGRPRGRRRRRILLASVGVLALILAAAGGVYAWARTQWYVAAAGGQVGIFRGLQGSLAGWQLSSLEERTGLPLAALQPYEQERVHDGVAADDLAAARRLVHQLHQEACSRQQIPPPLPVPSAAPHGSASPAPSPPPSPAPAPTPSPSSGTRLADCGAAS